MKLPLLLILFCASPLWACCMVPFGYPGDVDQKSQQVLIVHRDGHQEMVIKISPFFKDTAQNPESLTWILTVPSTPTGYRVADAEVLKQGQDLHARLFALATEQWKSRTDFFIPDFIPRLSRSGFASARQLEVGEAVEVGPYTITPVRALGMPAFDALNVWLAENGFPREEPDHLRWFIDNNFTFLCIHIRPPQGKAATLDLPPLQVGFASERAYYPAKFSSRQGDFGLELTIISDKPLEYEQLTAMRLRLDAFSRSSVQLHNLWSVQPLPEKVAPLAGANAGSVPRWFVNHLASHGFNGDENGRPAIKSWTEDVFFAFGGVRDELPGFWYYGDQQISWAERMFREHALAGIVTFSGTLLLVLVLKGRQNRRRMLKEKQAATAPVSRP